MPMPPPSSLQIAQQTRRALSRKVLDLQDKRIRYVSPHMMRVYTRCLSIDPNWKAKMFKLIDAHEMDGTVNGIEFLTFWKRQIDGQYDMASRDPRSDIPFETAYEFSFPNAGIENFWRTNPYWFVKELAVEGQAGLISGDRGYGKTDHALFLCELLIRLKQDHIENGETSHFAQIRAERRHQLRYESQGFGSEPTEKKAEKKSKDAYSSRLGLFDSLDLQIPTNISISPKSRYASYFPRAAKLSEFVLLMCKGAKAGKFSLILPDEMGFSFNKRRAMTTHNFGIEQILIVIRKFNAGLFAIAQSVENQLPVSLTGSAQTKIEKMSKTTAVYDIRNLSTLQRIRNIPKTSITFQTRAFAPFAVDMLPSLMVEVIAEKETIARQVDRVEWTDDMMYDAAIAFCETERLSSAEIASGKSGVLRGEVRYFAKQIDPETNRFYTVERIAREMEQPVEKIREILEGDSKEAKEKKERSRARAGHSAPVLSSSDSSDDSTGDSSDDSASDPGDGGSET